MLATSKKLEARMASPGQIIPDARKAIMALTESIRDAGVPAETIELICLRASQINGCSFCVDYHCGNLKKMEVPDRRIFGVAAWRDNPAYTDAERAALDLTESLTRISDRSDPVSDDVWEEAKRHFNEKALSAVIIAISIINVWNRFNVATKMVAGS